MNEVFNFIALFCIVFPLLFVGFWLVITTLFRYICGMPRGKLAQEDGVVLSDSGWGSAYMNFVQLRGCAKIVEYEDGFLFKVMPLFGGGKHWIPKGNYTIEDQGELLFSRYKKVSWNGRTVKLYGRLAAAID